MVLCVGLVEALWMNEAQSVQARILWSRAVSLIWHQSIITITDPDIHLRKQRHSNYTVTVITHVQTLCFCTSFCITKVLRWFY